MRQSWWKILCFILLSYAIIAGFLLPVPRLAIIYESIRNLYFHVPMWMTMMILFGYSFAYSIKYLSSGKLIDDLKASQFAIVGLIFGCLGMATGMEWATYTWGQPWSNDPKQTGSALSMLIYFAYFALRGSVSDDDKKAKIASVYNIFAFVLMFPLIYILPSMSDSLHPGSGGNPGFNIYSPDGSLRRVFYPAVIGWYLLGLWITTIFIRIKSIEKREIIFE